MPFEPALPSDVRSQMGRDLRRNAQRTVFDARQRLTSSSGTRASFDFELLDEYADSRISSMWGLSALFGVLGLFAMLWLPPAVPAIWAGLLIAANLGVVIACRRFKAIDLERFHAARWTTTFTVVESIYGAAWALMGVFPLFAADHQSIAIASFAIALVGIATNAVSTRTLPSATLSSTLPVGLAAAINLAIVGGPLNTLNWSLAAITFGGEVFFVYLARQLKDRPSVRGEAALIDLSIADNSDPTATLHDLKHVTEQLLVRNPSYRCNRCGFGARSHHWQCPSCKEWGTVKPLLNYAVV